MVRPCACGCLYSDQGKQVIWCRRHAAEPPGDSGFAQDAQIIAESLKLEGKLVCGVCGEVTTDWTHGHSVLARREGR